MELRHNNKIVIGIDEAGRGAWAGPLVVGAYLVNPGDIIIHGVNDSKKLSPKKRDELYNLLTKNLHGVGIVESEDIDRLGITKSVELGIKKAIESITQKISEKPFIILDGGTPYIGGYEQEHFNKGDSKYYSIACASIIAKVTRDNIMKSYGKKYPFYGFQSHMGYGTKRHKDSIDTHGILPIHRKSFSPIRKFINRFAN